MAALKSDPNHRSAKPEDANASPLARVMREFEDLVLGFETGLLRSLDHVDDHPEHTDDIRHEACRLAIAELSAKYMRKQIRRSLHTAESQARRVEEQLHAAADHLHHDDLPNIHNGYFRLYSTELFDMLGQPTDLRFGTLRFHAHSLDPHSTYRADQTYAHEHAPWVSVELALGSSFFVADSLETLPYHSFKLPHSPSVQNRGILSRKPEDNGAFPDFDSWLLFTFLGNGFLKLEIPVEMCADVYGGSLRGRENEEVHFWGVFVDDDVP